MAQAILKSVTETEDGILLTFDGLEGKKHSGKYTGKLNAEQLTALVGTQIAFTGKENNVDTITRAWDKTKPVYSEKTYAGDDRADG